MRTLIVTIAVTLAMLAASPSFAATQNNTITTARIDISNLAVVPFITAGTNARTEKKLSSTLDCALSGLCYREQEILTRTEQSLTNQLRQEVAEYYGNALVPQPQVTQHFLTMKKAKKDTPRAIAVRLGQQLNVDHVIMGIVWRYQQRVGNTLSADQPASVAFDLFLLNVANKKLVWHGSFDKTQQALSDNLFNAALLFKTGIKWLSAEELAGYGIKKTLEELPQ
ncbi:MAG: hypothetical protein B6I36_05235 [Desulfobacteraceae bacterium 4572_35.1]|nr:MAG: hypothetical protein B6I36_05235 [Desulfobacteraceae bacterium 4572_35.1]